MVFLCKPQFIYFCLSSLTSKLITNVARSVLGIPKALPDELVNHRAFGSLCNT